MEEIDAELRNLLNETGDDEDEIQITPAELISQVQEAWLNEKFAPEILPNKMDYVECLMSQISNMEENLQSTSDTDIKKSIHQLEIDRLRYLVTNYLRIRLEKIENFCECILKQETERIVKHEENFLTQSELQFAKNYAKGLDEHFRNVAGFTGLPNEMALEDMKNNVVKPNMYSFVFCKSKKNIEGIVIDDDNEEGDLVDVNSESQMIISYNSIANLVKNGDIKLI